MSELKQLEKITKIQFKLLVDRNSEIRLLRRKIKKLQEQLKKKGEFLFLI